METLEELEKKAANLKSMIETLQASLNLTEADIRTKKHEAKAVMPLTFCDMTDGGTGPHDWKCQGYETTRLPDWAWSPHQETFKGRYYCRCGARLTFENTCYIGQVL